MFHNTLCPIPEFPQYFLKCSSILKLLHFKNVSNFSLKYMNKLILLQTPLHPGKEGTWTEVKILNSKSTAPLCGLNKL